MITRAASDAPVYIFHPMDVIPEQRYTIWFDQSPTVYSLPGSQLMDLGVRVPLPKPSDVVDIDHQD